MSLDHNKFDTHIHNFLGKLVYCDTLLFRQFQFSVHQIHGEELASNAVAQVEENSNYPTLIRNQMYHLYHH